MTRKCIVAQCKSGYPSNNEKVSLFHVPKNVELQRKWIEALPKANVPITSAHLVCEKHFATSDILREYVHKDAAGNIIAKVTYKYPRLTDSAVPSIFASFEEKKHNTERVGNEQEVACIYPRLTDISTPLIGASPKENLENRQITEQISNEQEVVWRVSPAYTGQLNEIFHNIDHRDREYTHNGTNLDPKILNIQNETEENNIQEDIICEVNESSHDGCTWALKDHFSNIMNNENLIEMPKGWFRYTASDASEWVAFSTFEAKNEGANLQPFIRKSALLSKDGSVHISAHGKTLSSKNISLLFNEIETVPDLCNVLKKLSRMAICTGLKVLHGAQSVQSNFVYQDAFGEWRHKDCPILCMKIVCMRCRRLKKSLQERNRRLIKQNNKPKRLRLICKTEHNRDSWIAARRRIRSKAAVILKSSLPWLNEWERNYKKGLIGESQFLSKSTAGGLRVTLQGVIDMCTYMEQKFKFKYLLTGKLNQDALEVDLRILKPPTCGNRTVTEQKAPKIVVTVSELRDIYKPEKINRVEEIKQRLNALIENEDWEAEEILEHDYALALVVDCVVYYVTGLHLLIYIESFW